MELIRDENTLNAAPKDARNIVSKSFKKMGISTKSTNRKAFSSIDVNSFTRSTSEVSLKTQDSKPLRTRTNSAPKLNTDSTQRYPVVKNKAVEGQNQYGHQSVDISCMFRAWTPKNCKAADRSSRDHEYSMRTLRKATAIHKPLHGVCLSFQSSGTLQLFDSHRIVDMQISYVFETECSKEDSEPTHRVFREAPNEDIFTEEMEMMMTLQIANPLQESDTECEGDISDRDLSINDDE